MFETPRGGDGSTGARVANPRHLRPAGPDAEPAVMPYAGTPGRKGGGASGPGVTRLVRLPTCAGIGANTPEQGGVLAPLPLLRQGGVAELACREKVYGCSC